MVKQRSWQQMATRWLPVLIWMGFIFVLSDQPKDNIVSFGLWDRLIKKTAHFLAYAVLALLARRGTGGWPRPYLWALVITAVYAASDEFHQTFVPGRHGQFLDVLIDCAGGATALIAYYFRSR